MVSWWAAEGDANDLAGGHHGVLVGDTQFGMGESGMGFVLDGNGDGVILGNTEHLQLQDFSIELWAKRFDTANTSAVTPDAILFGYGSGGFGFGMFDNGNLFLTKVDAGNVFAPTAIKDLSFHHLAVTKAGSQVVFYVDGTAYPGPAYNPGFVFGTPAGIGLRGDNLNNSFLGVIDEVAVYNRALSSNEIQAIYLARSAGKCTQSVPIIVKQPSGSNAITGDTIRFEALAAGSPPLYYQWWFNETNQIIGATDATLVLTDIQFSQEGVYSVVVSNPFGVTNSSGAIMTVTAPVCAVPPDSIVGWWRAEGNPYDQESGIHGTPAGNTGYAPGNTGSGFVFDGSGDAIRLGNPPLLRIQTFTIEGWIRRASTNQSSLVTSDAVLFGFGAGGYSFGMFGSGNLFLARTGVGNVSVPTAIQDLKFHHLAVTKSGTTVVFYVDGVPHPAPFFSHAFTFTSELAIGARGDNLNNSFLGQIDEISVYSRALSGAEITAIYNSRTAGKCVIDGPPEITTHPSNRTVLAGQAATFSVVARGTPMLWYQWRVNGQELPLATNNFLALDNVQPSDAGDYSVAVSNLFGSVTSSVARLDVNLVAVYGNGQSLTKLLHSFAGPVTIELQNVYTSGLIFFTLDGSEPTFMSTHYTEPFVLTESAILRVIGYSPDFFQARLTGPILIEIVPTYTLTATNTGGGGLVTLDPPGGLYLSNTFVNVTAVPDPGWVFLHWLGDSDGGDAVVSIPVTRDKRLQAVFGTTLSTTVAGGGDVWMYPPGGVYPFGTTVRLTAVPQPGSYFGIWGNAASGNINPLHFEIKNPNPTISSLFAPLAGGQAALTLIPSGNGNVTINPRANVFTTGQSITLTATPELGQEFLGWSGDAEGAENPIQLVMNQSKTIHAHFTAKPSLLLRAALDGMTPDGFRFVVSGNISERYQVDYTDDLVSWTNLSVVTNAWGIIQIIDTAANSPNRFYRGLLLPD